MISVPSELDVLTKPSVVRLDSFGMYAVDVEVIVPTFRLPIDDVAVTSPALRRRRVDVALAFSPSHVVGVQAKAEASVFSAYVDDAKAWSEYGERNDVSKDSVDADEPRMVTGWSNER